MLVVVVVGATMLHRCSARFRPAFPRWGKVLRSEDQDEERPPQMEGGLTCGQIKNALQEGGLLQMGVGLSVKRRVPWPLKEWADGVQQVH